MKGRCIVRDCEEYLKDVDYQGINNEIYCKFGVDMSNGCDVSVKGTFDTETGKFTITSIDGQEVQE